MTKKLNRNYFSFFDLVSLPFTDSTDTTTPYPPGYGYRYKDGVEGNPRPLSIYIIDPKPIPEHGIFYWNQWRGMVQPLIKIKKDFTDCIQPYHTRRKLVKDLSQPIIGIINCLKGVLSLVGGIVLTALLTPLFLLCSGLMPNALLGSGVYTTSWILRGVFDIFRGVSQIATTPFTWMVKIPMRAFITRYRKKHGPIVTAEEKPEIKRLATKALSTLDDIKTKESDLKNVEAQEPAKKEEKTQEYEARCEHIESLAASPSEETNSQIGIMRNNANIERIKLKYPSDELKKARKDYADTLLSVVRMLFEINRKLTKSLDQGWATTLDHAGANVNKQFTDCYSIFIRFWEECRKKDRERENSWRIAPKLEEEPSEPTENGCHRDKNNALTYRFFDYGDALKYQDMIIDDDFMEKARQYLHNFSTY